MTTNYGLSLTTKLNVISEIFSDVKEYCDNTFKNPQAHIEVIFECRLSSYMITKYSVLPIRHEPKIFKDVSVSGYKPEYKNFDYEAKVFETVPAKVTSKAENVRLINLRKDFEQLIDNRREWIINFHLKLRELHKHPLYKAKMKIEGKIRQHKNFMESVEKYHLRDTAIKRSKTADIAKKLEVSTKNHNVKKQILWLQWTMADNDLPKLLTMLDRYKKAIELNDSYQEILTDIQTLRNENKLFTREKKQFEQVFSQYKVFDDVAAWEYKGQRHKIILMYPKLSLDKT